MNNSRIVAACRAALSGFDKNDCTEVVRLLDDNVVFGAGESAIVGNRPKPTAVAAAAEAWNGGHNNGSQSSKYSGPVLIVRGADDPFVTSELVSTAVFPRFKQATIKVIQQAGHWPQVEQPKALAKVLGEFLDAISQRSAPRVRRLAE